MTTEPMSGPVVTAAQLRELLRYEPESGKLFWRPRPPSMFFGNADCGVQGSAKAWNTRYAGRETFANTNRYGYLKGKILRITCLAHRVAWALYHGEWPSGQIDHINGVRTDNRISNLRCVSHTENQRNQKRSRRNTSGCTGVFWHSRTSKWCARIGVNSRSIDLGLFENKEAAIAARKAAERQYGFHPNHGEVKL